MLEQQSNMTERCITCFKAQKTSCCSTAIFCTPNPEVLSQGSAWVADKLNKRGYTVYVCDYKASASVCQTASYD